MIIFGLGIFNGLMAMPIYVFSIPIYDFIMLTYVFSMLTYVFSMPTYVTMALYRPSPDMMKHCLDLAYTKCFLHHLRL